jgi:poly(A) polymerase
MHPALEQIRQATVGTPYENNLWLVGGAVRDELLGKEHSADFDLVLESSALELAHFLRKEKVSQIHPVVYERFGTAMIRVADTPVELITARKESYDDASRKPDVEPATLEEDAARRDFTVNTLLRNIHSGEVRDPLWTGMADLQKKILRTPLDPKATFYDDPLRMLRAVRFKQQLGFEFAAGLDDAIRDEAHRLAIISEERIRDEWSKMLVLPGASGSMRDLKGLDLLERFAPEFLQMVDVEQGSYHHLDVWNHTLLVLDNVGSGNLTLALGALLHDIGKPETRFLDEEGNTRFFGHESVGASIARRMLQRLKFANDEIDPVVLLVKNHMRLGSMHQFTAAAARRLIRDLDGDVENLLALVDADARGLKPGLRTIDLDPIRKRLREVAVATPRHSLESPLSGDEIMDLLKLEPGPEVGRAKSYLLEKVLEGDLQPSDKDAARSALREYGANPRA